MTYAVTLPETGGHPTNPVARLVAVLGNKRASRSERVRARRTALAMSEEARIHAQMRYRRMRYRHMAS